MGLGNSFFKKGRKDSIEFGDFDSIGISVASPEQIRSWSFGEVRKSETVNYRTFKPERNGLFCDRIFGPVKDWECGCGRYKYKKYQYVVCDRCGVEVTEASKRRRRMGHIDLVVPIVHTWFLRKTPSKIGSLLGMKLSDLEKIVYYIQYVILEDFLDDQGNPVKIFDKYVDRNIELVRGTLISEFTCRFLQEEYQDKVKLGIGGHAIQELLRTLNFRKEIDVLQQRISSISSSIDLEKIYKKISIFEGFLNSNNKPEWLVMTVLPIIPPDLRPIVPLEGGRFATSDLNDLYRRVINRNNRLKYVKSLGAPTIMLHNEMRMLQFAVDVLFDNSSTGKRTVVSNSGRPLKSLGDILKGKQGRFRQNLLGKRVDYSGRSVVVVGPKLKMNQCGLPKEMALELFKPFIVSELMRDKSVALKSAKRILEEVKSEVWDILERVIKHHPIFLNRAPTLHRLGIQAFYPVLVEGKAIQLHPLACVAFNADFDGDQMAVHVPLSLESRLEAIFLMMSVNNVLSPSSGKPIVAPGQDIILGCCYLTKLKRGVKGEGKIFSNTKEVITAYQLGIVWLHAKIKIMDITTIMEDDLEKMKNPDLWEHYTTVGRVVFNEIVPDKMGYFNYELHKKEIINLISECYHNVGHYETIKFLENIKDIGFEYSTQSGISISIKDMVIPSDKQILIEKSFKNVGVVEDQFEQGVITEAERYNKVVDIWTHLADVIGDKMFEAMRDQDEKVYQKGEPLFNYIHLMCRSGARGSEPQVRQLAGMRGLMVKPQKKLSGGIGEIIEQPVLSNFREGLTVLEYFLSNHGGRKGLADTALKTADAGYLTRRLVDATQDLIVCKYDCGSVDGVSITELKSGSEVVEDLESRITGRFSMEDIVDTNGVCILKKDDLITDTLSKQIIDAGIKFVVIRSVLTCMLDHGVCVKCYGVDLATGKVVRKGSLIGVIAAQSIGEPGTQLTLRTFHIGGTSMRIVGESDVTAPADGVVQYKNLKMVKNKTGHSLCVSRNAVLLFQKSSSDVKNLEEYAIPYGSMVMFQDKINSKVSFGDVLLDWDPYNRPIIAEEDSVVQYIDIIPEVTLHQEKNKITGVFDKVIIRRKSEKLSPRIKLTSKSDPEKVHIYPLPIDTSILVEDKTDVSAGEIFSKIPIETFKTRDITGGLPRISELVEARKPRIASIVSEIDGSVSLDVSSKGGFKIIISNEKTTKEYIVSQFAHLLVYNGDYVKVGESLTSGIVNPHDILRLKGSKACQEYLINEIQGVYRQQGVVINDKHIEVIVHRMLSYVKILNSGDNPVLTGTVVNLRKINGMNRKLGKKEGKRVSTFVPILLGITKVALLSDSFISSSSFQETSRVLTDASFVSGEDKLIGVKENVIIGRRIPAGTGFSDLFLGGEN